MLDAIEDERRRRRALSIDVVALVALERSRRARFVEALELEGLALGVCLSVYTTLALLSLRSLFWRLELENLELSN